jgi:Sec-independent protein translocase protein TatA
MAAEELSQLHQALVQQQVIIVISALASLAGTVAGIIFGARRQPPLDREMYEAIRTFTRDYPSKKDMDDCAGRHKQSIAELRDELNRLRDAQNASLKDVFDRIEKHRESTNTALREIEVESVRSAAQRSSKQ